MSETKVSEKMITIANLPFEVDRDYAKRATQYDQSIREGVREIASQLDKGGAGMRAIFRTAHEKLFDLTEGAPHQALFEEPPITLRLPLHIFSGGQLFSLSLAENETLEWAHDRPTRASLLKCLGLPEDLDNASPEGKFVGYLEEWLFLDRLAAFISANMHKKKA